MDKETKNRAIQAAEVLARQPALFSYLEAYFEDEFVSLCRTSKPDQIEERERAFFLWRSVEDCLLVLKNLAQEAQDNG